MSAPAQDEMQPPVEAPTRSGIDKRRFLLKALVAIVLWAALLAAVDLDVLARSMRVSQPGWLVLATALVALSVAGNAVGYWFVGAPFGLGASTSLWISTRAWTYGLLTPARVGELWVGHAMRSRGVPLAEAAASVVLVRLVMLAYHVALAAPLLLGPLGAKGAPAAALAIALSCALGAVVILRPSSWPTLVARLPGRIARRLEPLAREATLRVVNRPVVLGAMAVTQLVRLLLMFFASYFVFRAVGVEVPLTDIVSINSASRLVALLPVSISGLGVREGMQAWLFHQICAIDPAAVVAMGIWMNLITYGFAGLVHLLDVLHPLVRGVAVRNGR